MDLFEQVMESVRMIKDSESTFLGHRVVINGSVVAVEENAGERGWRAGKVVPRGQGRRQSGREALGQLLQEEADGKWQDRNKKWKGQVGSGHYNTVDLPCLTLQLYHALSRRGMRAVLYGSKTQCPRTGVPQPC